MIVESHVECSVVQMAGRLREGVDTLYIVTDSLAHEDLESVFEWYSVQNGRIVADYNIELEALFKCLQYDPNDPFSCAPQQYEQISNFVSFLTSPKFLACSLPNSFNSTCFQPLHLSDALS